MARVLLGLLVFAAAASAQAKRDPARAKPGSYYEWDAGTGIRCFYRLPPKYKKKRGAPLLVLLHDAHRTPERAARDHDAKKAFPGFLLVLPDLPPYQPMRPGPQEFVEPLREWIAALRGKTGVGATYVVGHGAMAAAAFGWAARFPEEVQGVVASDPWLLDEPPPNARQAHQAVALVCAFPSHGGAPGMRYLSRVRAAGVERVQMHYTVGIGRSDRNVGFHVDWCLAMTSSDESAVAAPCARMAATDGAYRDQGALHLAATRWSALGGSRTRTRTIRQRIEEARDRHLAVLPAAAQADPPADPDAAHVHLAFFLDAYAGVPGADVYPAAWQELLGAPLSLEESSALTMLTVGAPRADRYEQAAATIRRKPWHRMCLAFAAAASEELQAPPPGVSAEARKTLAAYARAVANGRAAFERLEND